MTKMITNIGYALFVGLLFLMGLMLLATKVPVFGGIELKIVQSGSMEPNIPVGSLIVVKTADQFKKGDVITFGADTKTQIPTTHRIVDVQGSGGVLYYTTRGDANDVDDPKPVIKDDIIGKVVLSVPTLGFLLDFARTPRGFLFLVGVPAFLIVLDELRAIVRELGRMRKKGRRRAYRKVRTRVSRARVEQPQPQLQRQVRPRRTSDSIVDLRSINHYQVQ